MWRVLNNRQSLAGAHHFDRDHRHMKLHAADSAIFEVVDIAIAITAFKLEGVGACLAGLQDAIVGFGFVKYAGSVF